MPKSGWIIAFADDESAPVKGFWAKNKWVTVDDPNAPGAFDRALFYPESCHTVQAMRMTKGSLQSRNQDRDVRLVRAEQSLRLI